MPIRQNKWLYGDSSFALNFCCQAAQILLHIETYEWNIETHC